MIILYIIIQTGLPFQVHGLCTWIRSDVPQQRLYHLEIDCCVNHIASMIFELKIKNAIMVCSNGVQKSEGSK